MQTRNLTPQPPLRRGEGEPAAYPTPQRQAAARPQASSQSRRRSKADSLRLVHRLKQTIAVGAMVAFSVFGGLVATRLPSIAASASAATSSSTSSSSSTSTSGGGFFGQGSSGSGVSGPSASSSSSSPSAPISGTSVS